VSTGPALAALVAQLLTAVEGLTHYPVPNAQPSIMSVPHAWLEREVCHKSCRMLGWFPKGATIYLDSRLDPVNDLAARSILLHELVHFVQQESGAYAMLPDCLAWNEREREALTAQFEFLRRASAPAEVYAALGPRPAPMGC
jgi:hypothetical protein